MKKLKFFALIFVLIFAGCKKDDDEITVRADIKKITQYSYSANSEFEKIELTEKEIFEYDQNGNLTYESWYGSNEQFEGKIIYRYNGDGKLIEAVEYDENNNPDGDVYTYGYDDNGNKNAWNVFYNGTLEYTDSLKVDSNGNIIEYRGFYYVDGIAYSDGFEPSTCKYDENNDIIEWNEDGARNRETYVYTEYDQHGNWLKREHWSYYANNESFGVSEREYEYY